MRPARNLFALELNRGIGKWAALPLTAIGVFIARSNIGPGPTIWPLVVSALGPSAELMGPIAAGLAAVAGGRSRRRHTESMEQLSARGPLAAGLAELTALLVWVLAAYALVLAILFIPAAFNSTWSGPDLPRTIAAGLGLLLLTTVGFVAGRLISFRLTPLFVAIAVYIVSISGNQVRSGYGWSLLLPANLNLYDQFNRLNTVVAPAQIVWYLALSGAAVSVWAMIKARTRVTALLLTGCAAVAVASGAVLFAQDGQANRPGVAVAWRCAGVPALCIHPSMTSARDRLHTAFAPVVTRLDGSVFQIKRIEQRPRGLGSTPTAGAIAFGLDDTSSQAIQLATQEVAVHAFGGADHCSDADGSDKKGLPYEQIVVAWAMGNRHLFTPGDHAQTLAQNYLLALSGGARQQWLETNQNAIRSCDLTVSAFQ